MNCLSANVGTYKRTLQTTRRSPLIPHSLPRARANRLDILVNPLELLIEIRELLFRREGQVLVDVEVGATGRQAAQIEEDTRLVLDRRHQDRGRSLTGRRAWRDQ